MANVVQHSAQTFFWERDPLPKVQGGRAIVKAVCQYAHDPQSDEMIRGEMIAELEQLQQTWRAR